MKINIKDWVAKEKKILKGLNQVDGMPFLLVLQIGDDSASNSYIKGKIKDGEDTNTFVDLVKFNKNTHFDKIKNFIVTNGDYYHGIILQEPSGLKKSERAEILSKITDEQDVDGFKTTSRHKACTPAGIMEILKNFYNRPLAGEVAVVVGKGELVGAPLVPMLMKEGCTIISCNSKTPDLAAMTRLGDIVISAVGKKDLIKKEMLKTGAFVIDAGITFDEEGKICGDCDKALYDDQEIWVTTVPGGVGLVTRLMLMKNTRRARKGV